jgi:hypothetical protein
LVPTTYLVGVNKSITIDFDVDLADYLAMRVEEEQFRNYLYINIDVLSTSFYSRYAE